MKRDYIRDYATEAFRFYARCGKVSAEEYRITVCNAAMERAVLQTEEARQAAAKNAVSCHLGAIYDIEAVKKTLEILSISGKGHIVKAVECVYFTLPNRPLTSRDVVNRVRHYALMCPASECTVYRWLKKARNIFAEERGLRKDGVF